MAKGKTGVTMNWGGLDRAVGRAVQNLNDQKAVLRAAGVLLEGSTADRFQQGVAPDGTPWTPSARSQRDNGVALNDTGRLLASITSLVVGRRVLVGSHVGTGVKYAAIHQHGGQTGRNHAVTMPARPFIGITDEDRRDLKELVETFVAKAFGVGGKR